MSKRGLWWKVPAIVTGVVLGLGLLLLLTVAVVVVTPSTREAVLDLAAEKGLPFAREKTGLDIDWEHLYISPLHESPKLLYRAYKGREDLPVNIEADSLFVGHRGQDTLLYAHSLSLRAILGTNERGLKSDFTAIPIEVDELHIDETTFHSDSLIAAVGIDVLLGNLDATSPELNIAKGHYAVHGLNLADTYIGIDLRETPPDTTAKDTTPTLMAFDVPDGLLSNIRFVLTPLGLDVQTRCLDVDVLADVGASIYDVRRISACSTLFTLGNLSLPIDTIHGQVQTDLKEMLVDAEVVAEIYGNLAAVRGRYDIDRQGYNVQANVERVDLTPFLKNNTRVVIAGDVEAEGQGLDFDSRSTTSKIKANLTDCIYDNIDVSGLRLDAELRNKALAGTLHLPVTMLDSGLTIQAQTEHKFRVGNFLKPKRIQIDEHAQLTDVRAHAAGENWQIDSLQLDFTTNKTTSLDIETQGLSVKVGSPMHLITLLDRIPPLTKALGDSTILTPLITLADLTMLDTLRRLIPDLSGDIVLTKGSPLQHIIERKGLDIDEIALSFASDTLQTGLALDASIPDISHPGDSTAPRLPAATAALRVAMTEGKTTASLAADSKLTDGVMSVHNLRTDAALRLELERVGRTLNGTGRLQLDSLAFGSLDLGSRTADISVAPSERHENALQANIHIDDVELDIVDSLLHSADIDLSGAVRATAMIDGLPDKSEISAEVVPTHTMVRYKPYGIELSLGETPIVMERNHLELNGLPVYGVDSTFLTLTGGLDLDSMWLDIALKSDSFAPANLVEGGPIPVHGDLATAIDGHVKGALDSILVDLDVTVLPVTDVTYPIDEKNMAQVKPHGLINVKYDVPQSRLDLGGRINVDEGVVRYSPKIYPIMPFRVDSGSHVDFHGPLGKTMLHVSASQKVKANVQSEGEQMRQVDFITGVRVNGELDSIGLEKIGFFLEAPEDEVITEELASLDEDQREGIAATLLATGMYMGESNVAAQNSGYALTSIVNSRIDAAMSNSKLGKFMDINITSSQEERMTGTKNNYGLSLSKSFFEDRFRITVGASLSDNPEANSALGLYATASAEYKLTKEGNVLLRVFTQNDYNNIIEGDLQRSGIGVRATKDWRFKQLYRGDSIMRTYTLMADADVAYRSNNSLGPNLTLTHSIKNLMGRNETFSIKGYGAYYWALQNRQKGAPKMTDTYKLGVDATLVFPYLHWPGENNPNGDTRYKIGYLYENIAGGYGVHKVSGSLSYFIQSPHSKYITHVLTPFSLSIVMMKAELADLMDKGATYPQLFKLIAGDEFIPSVGYEFTYNDYQSKRPVNTMLDIELKEASNLINGIYCMFGYKWDDINKPLGNRSFDQFVKMSTELHNKFNFTDKICIATRLYGGALLPVGNSISEPLSESFYAGGPNNMRAAARYSYGPGNYYSSKYNQAFFHSGAVKLEGNFEFRFPIVWKLFGAAFVDAGNVWNWYNTMERLKDTEFEELYKKIGMPVDLYDGLVNNPYLLSQIALGTGAGLRLDIDGLVIRFDLGVGIHTPYQTYKYDKKTFEPDYDQPINTYYNIPFILDGLRLNFGIGYPF